MGQLTGTYGQFSNVANIHQGPYHRALFVCSAGLLRSATAAAIFAGEPYNWNTRSVGSNLRYALNPITLPLMAWADSIYVMEMEHRHLIRQIFPNDFENFVDKIRVLNVPDHFPYRHPELIALLKERLPAVNPPEVNPAFKHIVI